MKSSDVVVIALSALIGYMGQGNAFLPVWFHVLIFLVPVLWVATQHRVSGGLVLFAFHALASRGLIEGSVNYLSVSLWQSVLLWLAFSVAIFIAGLLVWHPQLKRRRYHLVFLLILLVIPPFSFLVGSHPLMASGWLFPGLQWFGVAFSVLLMLVLSWRPLINSVIAIIPLLFVAGYLHQSPSTIENWKGHTTRLPVFNIEYQNSYLKDYERYQLLLQKMASSNHDVHVFPESIGGYWTGTAARYWTQQMKQQNKTLIMGALQPIEGGGHYNVIVKVDRNGSQVIYRQRYPMPVGSWKPWSSDTTIAAYMSKGFTVVDGRKTGLLICYEAVLLFPILQSLYHRPDTLLFITNLWWAPESVLLLTRQAMVSMARLFGVSLIESSNL